MFVSDNTVAKLFGYLSDGISDQYDEREALNVTQLCFEELLGLSRIDLVMNADTRLSESEILKIHHCLKELKSGRPVQHVIGYTHFCDLKIEVNEHVLIPRPETEELVAWVKESVDAKFPTILDLCTGSGCIALALKKFKPSSVMHASDLSKEALDVAYGNSISNALEIQFHQGDILQGQPEIAGLDVIISNPPYVSDEEREELHSRVLEHEPHMALFSPGDPLKFYRVIAGYSLSQLNPGGQLFFELSVNYADQIADIVRGAGFEEVEVRDDINGRPRMLRAKNPTKP
jgi:release factor glutamine methyltransferase